MSTPRQLGAVVVVAMSAHSAWATPTPLKPHHQLVHEVYAFLVSDVGFDGILTLDNDPTGDPVPPYFYHYAIDHDDLLRSSTTAYPGYASISYPGYTASIGVDAFLAYWAYTGDPQALQRARDFADWLLPRRTPSADLYGNWVYSTQTDAVMGGGFDEDTVMSDKPGMFGVRCLRLHDITGDASYLTAATEIADTYVATQLSGGVADDGRWPFRVRPVDGYVRQDYTSHLIPAIRLLEAMEERAPGMGYGASAQRAWDWLLNNPLNPASADYMHWEGFYEDINAADSVGLWDHYSAENTLEALLSRDAPGDRQLAVDILDWSTTRYLSPSSAQNGWGTYDPAILEWDAWPNTTYAATGQWAFVNLLLEEATRGTGLHDPTWKTRAVEALHTLTYGQGMEALPDDGRMLTTIRELSQPQFGDETWYEQNFNTVIYLLRSFGLAPELAPDDEDHLIRFTGGELQAIDYDATEITTTWRAAGTATFKLVQTPVTVQLCGVWTPVATATTPGWSWDPATRICEVRHLGGLVRLVTSGPTSAGPRPGTPTLGAPYPNPFHPSVVLPYHLPQASQVRMTIYDARGRRVATLLRGDRPAGPGVVRWDGLSDRGDAVANGVYRVVLDIGEQRLTGRLVLSR